MVVTKSGTASTIKDSSFKHEQLVSIRLLRSTCLARTHWVSLSSSVLRAVVGYASPLSHDQDRPSLSTAS